MDLGRKRPDPSLPVSISAPEIKVSYPSFNLNEDVAKKFCEAHPCKVGQEFTAKVKLKVTGQRQDEYGHSLTLDVESIDGIETPDDESEAKSEKKSLGYTRPKQVKETPDMSAKTLEND